MKAKLVVRRGIVIGNSSRTIRPRFHFIGLLPAWFLILLLAAAPARLTRAQVCDPAPSGIIGWWMGNGDASDLIGGNNGALKGGATATAAGMVGQAFSFDGTNSY